MLLIFGGLDIYNSFQATKFCNMFKLEKNEYYELVYVFALRFWCNEKYQISSNQLKINYWKLDMNMRSFFVINESLNLVSRNLFRFYILYVQALSYLTFLEWKLNVENRKIIFIFLGRTQLLFKLLIGNIGNIKMHCSV